MTEAVEQLVRTDRPRTADSPRLVQPRPFLIAAALSLAAAVVLFAFLAVLAPLVVLTGCLLGARRGERTRKSDAVISVGLGMAIGPVAYLLLWAAVSIFD